MADDDSDTYGLQKDEAETTREPTPADISSPVEQTPPGNRVRRKKKPRRKDPHARLDQILQKLSPFIPAAFVGAVVLTVAGTALWLFRDPPEINESLLSQITPTMTYEEASDLFDAVGFLRFDDVRATYPAVGSMGARKRGEVMSESQTSALDDYEPTGGLEWSDGKRVAVLFFEAGRIAGPPYVGTPDKDGNYVAERVINSHWSTRDGADQLISATAWKTDFEAFDQYLAGLKPTLAEDRHGWPVPAELADRQVTWKGNFAECDEDDGDVRFSDLRLTHAEACHISFRVAKEDIPSWLKIPPNVQVTFHGTIPRGFGWITQISSTNGTPEVSNVPHGTILISDPQFAPAPENDGGKE